jgi:hypothetical protein
MIVVKSLVVLVLAVAVQAQAQAQNNPNGLGMRMHKRNDPTMKKRVAEAVARLERRHPQIPDILFPQPSNTDTSTASYVQPDV